jgi:aminotransferase EvaB
VSDFGRYHSIVIEKVTQASQEDYWDWNGLMAVENVVPFNDLSRSVRKDRELIDVAVQRVIDSGWFVLGPENEALERELGDFVGTRHVVNVGNGTDALELGLAALGVGLGDEVLTVANAGAYASTATLLLGAEPVYVDVDPETLLMSGATLQSAISQLDKTPKAIVVTHLYGALAPMGEILELAKKYEIPVLEDCAQSLGAKRDGKLAGSFGDIATTSFYPTKNLGALGDGGAVFTNNENLAASVRQMRQYGWKSKYSIEGRHGKNSRLDEIQAAILRAKLPHLNEQNNRRKAVHSVYEIEQHEGIRVLNRSNDSFVAHLAVVVSENRHHARSRIESAGVKTDIHYPIPDHKQQFPDFNPRAMPLDVTDWASRSVFSIPMFPELTNEEVLIIAEAIRKT